jgi:hypothetical protein
MKSGMGLHHACHQSCHPAVTQFYFRWSIFCITCCVWCENVRGRRKPETVVFIHVKNLYSVFFWTKLQQSYHFQSKGLLHLSNPRCSSCVCVHCGCYLLYILHHLVSYTGDHIFHVIIFLFLNERKADLWDYPTICVCVLICVASFSFWTNWWGITEQWYECFSVGNHPKSNYPHSVQGVCVYECLISTWTHLWDQTSD